MHDLIGPLSHHGDHSHIRTYSRKYHGFLHSTSWLLPLYIASLSISSMKRDKRHGDSQALGRHYFRKITPCFDYRQSY